MPGENRRDIGRIALFRQLGQRIEIVQRLVDGLRRRCCSLAMSAPVCRTGRRAGSG
jgi:hypothetical protein